MGNEHGADDGPAQDLLFFSAAGEAVRRDR